MQRLELIAGKPGHVQSGDAVNTMTVPSMHNYFSDTVQSYSSECHKIFERKSAALRDCAFRESLPTLNKANHLTAFCA